MEKRILCVKLDPEDFEAIERIAKSRGIDKSKLIRELIETHLLNKRRVEAETSELDKLVSEAKEKMDLVYKRWVEHCEQHASEVVEKHRHLKHIEARDQCLKNSRGLILMDLQTIARDYIKKIKSAQNVDQELKREYYKKVWELIDQYLA